MSSASSCLKSKYIFDPISIPHGTLIAPSGHKGFVKPSVVKVTCEDHPPLGKIEGAVNTCNDQLDCAEQKSAHQVGAPEHPEYLDKSLNHTHVRVCISTLLGFAPRFSR